jgi:hypothetical protein
VYDWTLHVSINDQGFIVKPGSEYRQPNGKLDWVILTDEYETLLAAQNAADEKTKIDRRAQKQAEETRAKELLGPAYDTIMKFFKSFGVQIRLSADENSDPFMSLYLSGDQITTFAEKIKEV